MRKGLQHVLSRIELDNSEFQFEGKTYIIVGYHNDDRMITTRTPFWDIYLPKLQDNDGKLYDAYIYSYSKFESGKEIYILEAMEEVQR